MLEIAIGLVIAVTILSFLRIWFLRHKQFYCPCPCGCKMVAAETESPDHFCWLCYGGCGARHSLWEAQRHNPHTRVWIDAAGRLCRGDGKYLRPISYFTGTGGPILSDDSEYLNLSADWAEWTTGYIKPFIWADATGEWVRLNKWSDPESIVWLDKR